MLAGPTASGKSDLAFALAEVTGGPIVNADALQVYDGWRILSARPGPEDLVRHPHALYGHVPFDAPYSVGDWLRDVAPFLNGPPPIILGGTGLYFRALTEGLADIPAIPATIRADADRWIAERGSAAMAQELDPESAARIDTQNPKRVQRAWEVLQATGKGIAAWQDETPAPVLPLKRAQAFVLDAPKDWLSPRIDARFDQMMDMGALDEARAMVPNWDPALQSSKAIGAPELIAHLKGHMSLDDAIDAAKTATRQYAKRQRTWFRARMRDWTPISCV